MEALAGGRSPRPPASLKQTNGACDVIHIASGAMHRIADCTSLGQNTGNNYLLD